MSDLISREALKKVIHSSSLSSNREWLLMDLDDIIDNAPTVEIPTELCKGCRFLKDCETCEEKLKPQGEIRWTDKLSITSSGDIIDFEGRVVGHINLEDVKEGDKK